MMDNNISDAVKHADKVNHYRSCFPLENSVENFLHYKFQGLSKSYNS
ncbi:MAG: hypothetical protein ACFFD4_05510 [Candidatus Odinarchaeota archaeon]